jgi:HK97 family phage major capsid protein
MHYPSRNDLSAFNATALRTLIARLDQDLRDLTDDDGELRTLDPKEAKQFDQLLMLRDDAQAHLRIREAAKNPNAISTGFNLNTRSQIDARDALGADAESVRSSAVALADGYLHDRSADHLTDEQRTAFEALVRSDDENLDGSYIARRALITESADYRSAWAQLVTQPHPLLTHEEVSAIRALRDLDRHEYRAASEASPGNAGGYGIPVFIDPTIIMTAQGSGNPFQNAGARTVTVNTNQWKGVSSAGVTWSFDAEASAVSDDSPTLAQPVVPIYMARGFIPFSIEIGMDYPDFAGEMARLLSEGYNELTVDKFSRGVQSNGEPQGLLTALQGGSSKVLVTTTAAFGQEDVYKVWKSLPERFRRNASWMMSVDVNNHVRQMGTNTVFHAYTVGLPQASADQLMNSPVFTNSYFPDFVSTTGAANICVVGDFSNFIVAQRAGMSVELVPTLLDVTNNRPTGQRGWFAYARVGSGSVNDAGFRILENT